jgi:hypothetical protein
MARGWGKASFDASSHRVGELLPEQIHAQV